MNREGRIRAIISFSQETSVKAIASNDASSGASFQLLCAFGSQAVIFSLEGGKKDLKCRLRVYTTCLGELSHLRDGSTRHFAK